MSNLNDNLNTWGYDMNSKSIISIMSTMVNTDKLNQILDTIKIQKENDDYVLMVNGKNAGIISFDAQVKLKNVVYNVETKSIDFTFETENGDKTVSVDVSDLVDIYTAGPGLSVDQNQFFIKIDESTENYISVTENGVKITGIDEIINNINDKISQEAEQRSAEDTKLQQNIEQEAQTARDAEKKNADNIASVSEKVDNIKEPYEVDLTSLLYAEDTETISNSIGGIDNLNNTISENRNIIGTINNGSVSVSIMKLGTTTTLYYILDSVAGYTVNEINIKNDNGTLSRTITSHSMMTEEMVVDNLTSEQPTLPLSANQGKVLNDKIVNIGVYSLGNIGSSNNLSSAASADGVFNNKKNSILTFTIENEVDVENGIIFNEYTKNSTYQRLYRKSGIFERTITSVNDDTPFEPIYEPNAFYPGVLIDTQKLFELTKSSSEEDIKTALTFETTSGRTILPTAEILDSCLKNGFLLKSNWMPVSVTWNGAAYVLYIVGQNYMLQPNGIYTVAIKITDGKYSVFQNANKFLFASSTDIYDVKEIIDNNNVSATSSIDVMTDKISLLENRLNYLMENTSETVPDFDGTQEINDLSKSYVISNSNMTNTAELVAKSIIMNNMQISNDARLKVKAKNIEFDNANIEGRFPKDNGNTVVSVNDSEFISFKGVTFNSDDIYNGIEIGLNSTVLPKNIIFEDCNFEGTFSNNPITIFGTQNNSVITLTNCHFATVSNPLRLSNNSNASGVTVNIVNCSVDKWEETNKDYQGFLLLQDYTSKSSDETLTNNLFGNGKIKVNFVNLMYKDSKILPENIASVCGTKSDGQVVYAYGDKVGFIGYDETRYPTITFK